MVVFSILLKHDLKLNNGKYNIIELKQSYDMSEVTKIKSCNFYKKRAENLDIQGTLHSLGNAEEET